MEELEQHFATWEHPTDSSRSKYERRLLVKEFEGMELEEREYGTPVYKRVWDGHKWKGHGVFPCLGAKNWPKARAAILACDPTFFDGELKWETRDIEIEVLKMQIEIRYLKAEVERLNKYVEDIKAFR